MKAAESRYTPHARQNHHRPAIERVIRIMHESLDRRITLDELGRAAYISPFHFNRVFHSVVGIPPLHFLSALRIQMAKRLLVTTRQKVIDICLEVGFTSPGTFSRRFRDYVGLSPNHLRFLARRLASANCSRSYLPRLHSLDAEPGLRSEVLTGEVLTYDGFSGPVFLGLFTSPLPQSRPLGCCILERPGSYQMPRLPDGLYYLLCLGLSQNHNPWDLLLCESSLRGGSTTEPVRIYNGGAQSTVNLALRPAEVTDPPILLTLPWLMDLVPELETAPSSSGDILAVSSEPAGYRPSPARKERFA